MLLAETRRSRPTVGLVLGAGGIRGCAHAGVIQVLREAGIPIDVVVGASVGSIFGLGVAADLPTAYIAKVAHEASPSQMLRFYMGRLQLDRRNPIARMLWDAGSGRTFADLPVPFAVRATEMTLGRPTVLDSGPVIPAVQASIALPGVARPVRVGDSYYMDGGLFDTAPVSTAREMGADVVIAVCLGVNYVTPDFLRRRPWTRARFERWGRQRRPIRGSVIDHARFCFRILASSYEDPNERCDADLAIWPELGDIKPNSMFGGPLCYRQGVQAAQEMLPAIERLLSEPQQQAAAAGPP